MKKVNINDYMLIQITEEGWKHLEKTVGQHYIECCIKTSSYEVEINGEIWYRLQIHNVFSLLPNSDGNKLLYKTNVMIEDNDLEFNENQKEYIKELLFEAHKIGYKTACDMLVQTNYNLDTIEKFIDTKLK